MGGLARRAGTSLAPEPFLTPATRIHFLDEQRRHRRSGVAFAVLVVAALAVSGIPLSILISPLLVALVAIPVSLADTLVDVPPGLADWLDRAFNLLPTTWAALRRSDVDLPWDWLLGLFVVPGLVATLLLWALVRVTFRRAGVGGVLRRMQTRLPRKDDVAEQRGAPGHDSFGRGTTLRAHLRARDYEPLPEELARIYDPNPPADAVLVYKPGT